MGGVWSGTAGVRRDEDAPCGDFGATGKHAREEGRERKKGDRRAGYGKVAGRRQEDSKLWVCG